MRKFLEGSEEWVQVFVTYDPVEAEIVRDLLESGGIEVKLVSLKVTPYPVNIGRMGEVRLKVRASDEEVAKEAIERFRQEQGLSQ